MYRSAIEHLKDWQTRPNRKPLIIRGARQVGKSFLARTFGECCFDSFLEVNFEENPGYSELFDGNNPDRIVALELKFGIKIVPGKTLLFLDELQAAPKVFTALRFFYEKLPEIHVIAAGSLLEFTLSKAAFSVPVGRLEYLFLGPMSFEEFLLVSGKRTLYDFLQNYEIDEKIPLPVHDDLLDAVRLFFVVGGMPASIRGFLEDSFRGSEQEKQSITNTFYDDFGKYSGKADPARLRKVFDAIPLQVGQKLKYVTIDPNDQAKNLALSLDLLCNARIAYKVCHSSSNGVPLRAQTNERVFKLLFLDTGIMCSCCGLNLLQFKHIDDLAQVNQGAVSEQFVGQHLLFSRDYYIKPEQFYWTREKKTSNAEVDYVISLGPRVIPVEVKSGKTGTLKSMQVFLKEKKQDFAVRINTGLPSLRQANYSLPHMTGQTFDLLSIPFYLIGQLDRLIRK